MQAMVDDTLISGRFSARLLGLFAAVALTLAAVGIYSVLSYIVRGRRREIGIRTALGASTRDVLRLFVIEGMKPARSPASPSARRGVASATLLERLVFGVSAYDPVTAYSPWFRRRARVFVALVASRRVARVQALPVDSAQGLVEPNACPMVVKPAG